MRSTNVLILGGGIIGLTAAFESAQRGHQVTLLEQGAFGGQATGAAAGMLAPFSEIGEDPDDFFNMCKKSLELYPEWQSTVKEISGSYFEYNRSGSLHVVFHEADELVLETRNSWQKKWGVSAEIVRGETLCKLEPHLTKEAIAAMYYPEEHHIFAPDYVKAVITGCKKLGVKLFDYCGSITFEENQENGVGVTTEKQGSFVAEQCIIANGAWTSFLEPELSMRVPIFPIRGQICAFELGMEKVHHMIFSSQGYVVAKENGSLICGASEDIAGYDNSVTDKGIQRLKKWSRRLYPFLQDKEPYHTWAGLRPATQDGFPLIGRLPHRPNIILSSGHYRNGILLSVVNAKIVADLLEQKTPIVPISQFDPMRFQ
ncbi:glycine oxidase ThiO [Caldalkalibacillus mannanilyticus]|uniref:glycine oxidase ThiO n=1 Tax=Caldalkalibacillus mannanilyticus TaxID=1418 RepID=UPI00046AB7BF|nr:glycine oxidase ThiO [Caldalkalibacillus mannanilyticus]